MSEQHGKLVTCDICSETIFLKAISEKELDGGYTRWTLFEDKPEGWCNDIKIDGKYVCSCPKCTEKYKKLYAKLISELTGKKEVQK